MYRYIFPICEDMEIPGDLAGTAPSASQVLKDLDLFAVVV
jgi:hypothetical protein